MKQRKNPAAWVVALLLVCTWSPAAVVTTHGNTVQADGVYLTNGIQGSGKPS